jgi:hypothetical protein
MRKYIINNNIQIGDPLFPEKSLSNFVSNMTVSIGYEGLNGINAFRHMRISELDGGATYAEKVELANTMAHSVITQKNYRRNLEVI